MRIFLIGLPGSGKSTIGRQLALSLKLKFIDTDEEIISEQKKSIEDIFKAHGEDHFRKLEHEILKKVSQETDVIVSTGGGTPCFYNNTDIINEAGISIFLNVPVETIYRRMLGQKDSNRPMLHNKTDEEIFDFLKTKLSERLEYYSKAKLEFSGSDITAKEILEKLKSERFI